MDIAGAQRILDRFGRVDRILIKLPRARISTPRSES